MEVKTVPWPFCLRVALTRHVHSSSVDVDKKEEKLPLPPFFQRSADLWLNVT